MYRLKGDKESIGGKQKEERVYTNHEIKIEKGVRTVIYLDYRWISRSTKS
jgi:hypothetical protein